MVGKSADGFAPMGPYLVTRDQVPDPTDLEIRCERNGIVVQHGNTKEMIFDVAFLVHYISQYITLNPGDVIFTGTPEGVILGYPEDQRRWLEAGETVRVSITGLGDLETTIGSAE
jgi:2-keto-4-pentenoate hydratase/2-oxohepta-3-ene-1,7-dioic acid hydratase in catechol pathway